MAVPLVECTKEEQRFMMQLLWAEIMPVQYRDMRESKVY
jgi:hypothetical protein